MRCSKCGTESTSGRKFCPECGSQFSNRCAKCGADNSSSAKFCEDCGAALVAPAAAGSAKKSDDSRIQRADTSAAENIEGERKTVTALFADIKGSTELMEDLDPEEARAIIDPALKLMIDAAHRYDGYVVQSTGDGIFALFGAPVAHEDHPQRALVCGAADAGGAETLFGESAGRWRNRRSRRGSGSTPARWWCARSQPARVRSSTRRSGTRRIWLRGCRRGADRLDRDHREHAQIVRRLFHAQAARPDQSQRRQRAGQRLRGDRAGTAADAVAACGGARADEVRRARARDGGDASTPPSGRKRGHGQIVAAMAEPGVGKSRLFFEFKATSQSGWMVLETFSVSHGKAIGLSAGDRSACTAISKSRARTMNAPGAKRSPARSRSSIAVWKTRCRICSVLLGIVEGDDPLAQMDGQIEEAAHARSDQTDPAARDRSISR